MGGVVEEGGTAPIAKLAEYSSGGKTGTAQKVKDGRYAKGLYVSSFIGFAPLDKPKVVTLVVLDEPKKKWYGGTVAGPVFREVTTHALRELGVVPDLEKKEAEAARALRKAWIRRMRRRPKKKKKKVLAATRASRQLSPSPSRQQPAARPRRTGEVDDARPSTSLRDVVDLGASGGLEDGRLRARHTPEALGRSVAHAGRQ